MFRDESSKVIQRARAQCGGRPADGIVEDNPALTGSSHASQSPQTKLAVLSLVSYASSSASSASQPLSRDVTPLAAKTKPPPWQGRGGASVPTCNVPRPINPTLQQQGVRFYIEHYVLGHPGEPKTFADLSDRHWIFQPSMQNLMAAVGLASLSNLNGRQAMKRAAREQYGVVLGNIQRSLQAVKGSNIELALKTVVTLALFEVSQRQVRMMAAMHPEFRLTRLD